MAAVLELARQFVESHCKPKNTIIFATFDLEEMGGQVRHIFNQMILSHIKGGFFSESAMCFSNLQISKKKNIPKNYTELEI